MAVDFQVVPLSHDRAGDDGDAVPTIRGHFDIISFSGNPGVRDIDGKAMLMFERMDVDYSGSTVEINGHSFGLGRTPNSGGNRFYTDMIPFGQNILKAYTGGPQGRNELVFKSDRIEGGRWDGTLDDFWVKNVIVWYKVDIGTYTPPYP